jgi:hypothetical protein
MHYENKLQSKEFKIYSCAKHDTINLLKMPINKTYSISRGLSIYTLTLHKRYTSSTNKDKVSLGEDNPPPNQDNW